MSACDKHASVPAIGYHACPGCEIESLRKDAERYRWLRSRDLETISNGGVFAGMTPQNMVINLEDLDVAVDEAMAKEAK